MPSSNQENAQAQASKPWREDFDAIAATMAEALRGQYDGWATVTTQDVVVEDYSGNGGGKAYKLTNRANPAARPAALHILHPSFCPAPPDPIFFDRQRMAQQLFTDAGLSPARICDDPHKEWFVEEWVGDKIGLTQVSIEFVEEIARMVASIHAIDPAWYDDIRQRQCKQYPALCDAPNGCHIWWYTAFSQHFIDLISEKLHRPWIKAGPVPMTIAGSRIVTTHGDVHGDNLIRTEQGLKLIDMEAACVSYAIHDICYSYAFLCETDAQKEAFAHAYLVACGLPAAAENVFALRLDAERCKMATNFIDINALWGTVCERNELEDCNDLGPHYPKLRAVADRALDDPQLATEIVQRGFEQCEAVQAIQRDVGKPLAGMIVTVHRDSPEPTGRADMVINWDGTIQSTWERHRALVLGVDAQGQIVLTNYANTNERLQLCMDERGIPITGLRTPTSAAVPLHLAGQHAGKALVLSAITEQHAGYEIEFVKVGSREKALDVTVEPDGMIRLADRPYRAFAWALDKVLILHNECSGNQKFVLNDDATLSPMDNRDHIWALCDEAVRLVNQDDKWAERLTFCEEFAAVVRAGNSEAMATNEPQPWGLHSKEGVVLELASHRGMALSVGPYEDRDDVKRLVLVPIVDAERFIIAADHLSLVNGGAKIALGTPIAKH